MGDCSKCTPCAADDGQRIRRYAFAYLQGLRVHLCFLLLLILNCLVSQDYLRLNYFRMKALQSDDATKLSATLKILLETEVRGSFENMNRYDDRSVQWSWATHMATFIHRGEIEAAWSFCSLASGMSLVWCYQ
jgi:hypothetical protein